MKPTNSPQLWLIIGLGFGLRLQRLTFQPLWGDEGWSFYFATQTIPQLLSLTSIDIHPPLYYLLLKGWLFLSGNGAVTARFFSVICGTALIPVLYALGRRLFTKQVGLIAALLTAVMPMAIYYSQEVRMYGLVTVLTAISVYAWARQSHAKAQRRKDTYLCAFAPLRETSKWDIIYIIATTAALYTMYYAVFIVAMQVILGIRSKKYEVRSKEVHSLLLTSYSLLLYLPWLIYATPRLLHYIQNKRAVEGYLPLSLWHFWGDHVVAFSVGHAPTASQPYWLAMPFILLAMLGLFQILWNFKTRRDDTSLLIGYLFVPLLFGFIVNQIYPFTPPYYERTLFLAAPAYWLFIAVGLSRTNFSLSRLFGQTKVCPTIIYALLLLITSLNLLAFYNIPRYAQEDYRPLLANIAARATTADTLLASYQWQYGFYQAYLPAPRIFVVPGWGQGWNANAQGERLQMRHDLTRLLAESPRLWFPAHQTAGHIWEDAAEKIMAEVGYPTLLEWYSPQTKLILAGGSGEVERPRQLTANFADSIFLLDYATVKNPHGLAYQAGRDIMPVQFTWRKAKELPDEYLVSLRLADFSGRTWAIRDSYPQAGQGRFSQWAVGQVITDRHGLLVTAGTPLAQYRLLLSVRRVNDARPLDLLDTHGQPQGTELLLATIDVIDPSPPIGTAALPIQTRLQADVGQVAHLVGYSLGTSPFRAGQSLPLNLFWQALADSPAPFTISVKLIDANGQAVTTYQCAPRRPVISWEKGMLLRDPHEVPLPPTLRPSQYQVWLGFEGVPFSDFLLTTITTTDRPHNFQSPAPQITLTVNFNQQAKLVGLDLPQLIAVERLPLTLHWQALTSFNKNWTVFVHLVDDTGKIIAQQDQIPGGGQFPTASWLPQEYIADHYELIIPPDLPPTTYRLEIGLYDANDFSRLPLVDGGDHVTVDLK